MKKVTWVFVFWLTSVCLMNARASQSPSTQLLNQAFGKEIPSASVLWLTKKDKQVIADILQHPYQRLRIRYWANASLTKTVWVLNEIGKEKPITIGIYINNKKIEQLSVLAYRESRGDEVKHDFFTDQFKQITLTKNNQLSQSIDGITGATLSVRALKKTARLALWLHQKVRKNSKAN